ncbi:TlpA disulfide reductase family protein [Geotalea toluenoxydans]|uniref:TlpA disulfide reductase family protein n=1 Tax=Geotalea toluenoxydans TaxID=421624 RepID=UPI0006D1DF9A|nr:TlpA disulfide reductase family protein [Geotalea toluenoxydans]
MKLRSIRFVLLAMSLLLSAAPVSAALQKGQPAPPINVVTTSGQPVSLANYKGHVLVLDFFATWCYPCKEAIPHLLNLNRKYGKQGLQILGMSVDDGSDKVVKAFIAEKKINYPVAMVDEDLQIEYGLRSVPTIFVISKKGIVAEKLQGYSEEVGRTLENTIKRLLVE